MIFGSLVMWFAIDFHLWLHHSWKSLLFFISVILQGPVQHFENQLATEWIIYLNFQEILFYDEFLMGISYSNRPQESASQLTIGSNNTCCLVPLLETILSNCWFNQQEQTLIKTENFHSIKCFCKCHLHKVCHFVSASMGWDAQHWWWQRRDWGCGEYHPLVCLLGDWKQNKRFGIPGKNKEWRRYNIAHKKRVSWKITHFGHQQSNICIAVIT